MLYASHEIIWHFFSVFKDNGEYVLAETSSTWEFKKRISDSERKGSSTEQVVPSLH